MWVRLKTVLWIVLTKEKNTNPRKGPLIFARELPVMPSNLGSYRPGKHSLLPQLGVSVHTPVSHYVNLR